MIHLTWTVANNGIGPTDVSSWSDRIVLSSDDVYGNADDAYLASVQHDGVLAVGDSYVGQADVRLPIGISGNYHVFVETDEVNAVFEFFSKNNNIGESDFPIAVTLTDYADLEAARRGRSRNCRVRTVGHDYVAGY